MLCNYIIKGFERVRGVRKSLFEEMMFDLIFGREIVVMEIEWWGERFMEKTLVGRKSLL